MGGLAEKRSRTKSNPGVAVVDSARRFAAPEGWVLPRLRGARAVGLVALAWISLAVLLAVLQLLEAKSRAAEISIPPLLAIQLSLWFPWALVTAPVWNLHRAAPLLGGAKRLPRNLLLHAACATLLAALFVSYLALLELVRAEAGVSLADLIELVARSGPAALPFALAPYVLISAAAVGFALVRRARERENQLAAARLQALQHQMRPHFLFNTLHAVASLLEDKPAAAQKMLAQLSDLLRESLRTGEQTMLVPLSAELELAKAYLGIEQGRFEARLRVRYEVDPRLLSQRVPRWTLQPLVENAVRHGVERSASAGCIAVSIQGRGDELVIAVQDDGPGLAPGEEPTTRVSAVPTDSTLGNGVSLANLTARLRALYGDQASLELRPLHPRGAVAELVLPLETARSTERWAGDQQAGSTETQHALEAGVSRVGQSLEGCTMASMPREASGARGS